MLHDDDNFELMVVGLTQSNTFDDQVLTVLLLCSTEENAIMTNPGGKRVLEVPWDLGEWQPTLAAYLPRQDSCSWRQIIAIAVASGKQIEKRGHPS